MSNYSITTLSDPVTGYLSFLKTYDDGSSTLTKTDSASNIITTTETVLNEVTGFIEIQIKDPNSNLITEHNNIEGNYKHTVVFKDDTTKIDHIIYYDTDGVSIDYKVYYKDDGITIDHRIYFANDGVTEIYTEQY